MKNHWRTLAFVLVAGSAIAGEPLLNGEPRTLRGVPGEPLEIELTVETDRAISIHVLVPAVSNLVLRTVERVPIKRTEEGRFVQRRILLWQGVEAGQTTLTNLVAEIAGAQHFFPPVDVTIEPVEPAKPPAKEKAE